MLRDPKPVTINGHDYKVHKFFALAGREIVATYPVANLPKLGDYKASEDALLKLMAHVTVDIGNGNELPLNTRALIDSHVPDWEVLAKLEMATLEYNVSFFGQGRPSAFLEGLAAKLPQLITLIQTALSQQSSEAEKQPSVN